MIYDCFNFYNELDILEMRLNILYEYVDYFVIVESSVTHSGVDKPFNYELNKQRFSKFSDKIIYHKVLNTPNDFINIDDSQISQFIKAQKNRFDRATQPDYGRDFFQKESVRIPLQGCNDDDIIIVSDADEIINPKVLSMDIDSLKRVGQYTYYYKLNLLKEVNWYGSRIGRWGMIKNISLNELRGDNSLSQPIDNSGWHFSFMGGSEMVKNKLVNYSARDMVNHYVLNDVESNIDNGIDPFFRSRLTKVGISEETHPKYIIDNLDHYIKIGWIS